MSEPTLSPAGVVRRDEIGRLAAAAAGRRRLRRRATAAAAVAAVVAACVPWTRRPVVPRPSAVGRRSAVVVATAAPASAVVEYVGTDPTITDRLSVRPGRPRWTRIGDGELLAALASAGRPAGLVAVGGREILLFRDPPPR